MHRASSWILRSSVTGRLESKSVIGVVIIPDYIAHPPFSFGLSGEICRVGGRGGEHICMDGWKKDEHWLMEGRGEKASL